MTADWTTPAQLPPLPPDRLQLWRIELAEANPRLLDACIRLLTPAEQETAARRRAGQVREQFAVGRACLRLLLGHALALEPRNVAIVTGPHGKPHTPQTDGPPNGPLENMSGNRPDHHAIAYNVAHSKDTILIALRRHGAIGIDIEHIDLSSDPMEIATRWFTPKEIAALESIGEPRARRRLFFRYWTRKEAIAKADGRGLLMALDAFEVDLEAESAQPVPIHLPPAEAEAQYLLRDLDLGPNFAGALALELPDASVSQYNFPLNLAL